MSEDTKHTFVRAQTLRLSDKDKAELQQNLERVAADEQKMVGVDAELMAGCLARLAERRALSDQHIAMIRGLGLREWYSVSDATLVGEVLEVEGVLSAPVREQFLSIQSYALTRGTITESQRWWLLKARRVGQLVVALVGDQVERLGDVEAVLRAAVVAWRSDSDLLAPGERQLLAQAVTESQTREFFDIFMSDDKKLASIHAKLIAKLSDLPAAKRELRVYLTLGRAVLERLESQVESFPLRKRTLFVKARADVVRNGQVTLTQARALVDFAHSSGL